MIKIERCLHCGGFSPAPVAHHHTQEECDNRTCERTLPACCYPSKGATIAEKAYCAYNARGQRKGLNYAGVPCPTWTELQGSDVAAKWEEMTMDLISVLTCESS